MGRLCFPLGAHILVGERNHIFNIKVNEMTEGDAVYGKKIKNRIRGFRSGGIGVGLLAI